MGKTLRDYSKVVAGAGLSLQDRIWSTPAQAEPLQRQYPQQPLVGVGAIIIADGRVALIKRGKAPLLGEWSIPGGMLELGETLRQGAEREAFEETGLIVRATELLGVFERIVPDAEQRTSYHYVLIDFLCEIVSGQMLAGGDASDARWFTPEEVSALPLPEDTASVIRLAFTKSAA
jgi:ADP-ribose pyrophosphatase YjhB (NUDIX family)